MYKIILSKTAIKHISDLELSGSPAYKKLGVIIQELKEHTETSKNTLLNAHTCVFSDFSTTSGLLAYLDQSRAHRGSYLSLWGCSSAIPELSYSVRYYRVSPSVVRCLLSNPYPQFH